VTIMEMRRKAAAGYERSGWVRLAHIAAMLVTFWGLLAPSLYFAVKAGVPDWVQGVLMIVWCFTVCGVYLWWIMPPYESPPPYGKRADSMEGEGREFQ
jgi:hypothetical protein